MIKTDLFVHVFLVKSVSADESKTYFDRFKTGDENEI
jgi:hypothetical protein